METLELATRIIRSIYVSKTYSPFDQLMILEKVLAERDTTWKKLTAQINAQSKDIKQCISCLKKTSKPCHLIDTRQLRQIRDSRKTLGNSRKGSVKGNNPQKKGDKTRLIEQIITAIQTRTKIGDHQIYNLKTYLEPIRVELLAIILGQASDPIRKSDGFRDLETTAHYKPPSNLGLALETALIKVLPDREKNFIEKGEKPKKGDIDIGDYLDWWKLVSNINRNLDDPFSGHILTRETPIRRVNTETITDLHNSVKLADHYWDNNFDLQYYLTGPIPYPCKEDRAFHNVHQFDRERSRRDLEFAKYGLDIFDGVSGSEWYRRFKVLHDMFGEDIKEYYDQEDLWLASGIEKMPEDRTTYNLTEPKWTEQDIEDREFREQMEYPTPPTLEEYDRLNEDGEEIDEDGWTEEEKNKLIHGDQENS